MDIPDLEELQWLESHTVDDDDNQFDDVDFELDVEPPSPDNKSPKKPTLSLPPKPSPLKPHPQKKRIRSDLTKSISLDTDDGNFDLDINGSDGKRSRTDKDEARIENRAGLESEDRSGRVGGPIVSPYGIADPVESNRESDNDDDEWLRLSPPRAVVEEMEVAAEGDREERILSRYATEIDGDCVPVTGLDGERVYAKMCSVELDDEGRKKNLSFKGDFNGLLQEPVRVLMQKVEHEEFTKALHASVDGGPTEVATPKAPADDEQLWVDKYAPSSFTELLSDEQTNREVLLWLKQWDSCVFGSEIKSTTDDVLSSLRRHSSVSQHSKQFTKSYFGNNRETRLSRDTNTMRTHNRFDNENNVFQDIQEIWSKRDKSSGPPEPKVSQFHTLSFTLLWLWFDTRIIVRLKELHVKYNRAQRNIGNIDHLYGLGKTTLAHVAARHCGYRVVEINASDDRSSSTLEAKILDVVQMNSVIADSKPKCLVIDEIDGALGDGKGAVEIILQLVSAERKYDNGKEAAAQEGKSSRKKQRNSVLLRPVICICNDLYAPALRPLRQVAKVHIFVQPSVSRIVNRLKYICNKEGVKTSSVVLSALAEYTECDIRSCLNTLQFLNKKKEILNVLEISSQVVGRKDTIKSAFDIWKEIFQKRKKKQARKSNNLGSMSKEFEFLYSMISNRGDYDLILDGIHENILQLRYVDPVMQKTAPNVVGRKDRHVSHMEQQNITKYFEAFVNKILCRRLSFSNVALHLLSENDKRDLGKLVNNMVSYAITYKNIQLDHTLRHEDALGATTLSFDPPLSEFIHFKGYNLSHFDLALAVKQVLVHEVAKQKILQSSLCKSADLLMKDNHALVKNDTGSRLSSKSSYTNGSAVKKMNGNSPTIQKSGLSDSSNSLVAKSGGSIATTDKVKLVERTKRPSGGLTNFFDRYN
ncbi:chromosome transmission fidelity protein 18 homolog [Phtheirospermum japonicum]|uniref:Chromosome transmission fidelity protein 18 homolog n=1 Tax=Phtheirospermum japonicum TaxID=374723 RepID=A0A830C3X9_9LAMI|nr:chromosome transmission fidelity protein 18 homolog [Phtheirospermum japonicum]